MKKLLSFILFAFLVTGMSDIYASLKPELKGIWNYEVSTAPYNFKKGNIIFSETDGKILVTVKLSDGTEFKGQDINIKKNIFSFKVQIEYEDVKINGKVIKNKMIGKADSSMGIMDLIAEKEVIKPHK